MASPIWIGVVNMKFTNMVASWTLEQSTAIRLTTSPVVYWFLPAEERLRDFLYTDADKAVNILIDRVLVWFQYQLSNMPGIFIIYMIYFPFDFKVNILNIDIQIFHELRRSFYTYEEWHNCEECNIEVSLPCFFITLNKGYQ